jgi:cell division protein FtsN
VSPERDEPTEDQEQELYEDVPPRSIFAATWFRVVLVVIVLGVVGAIAVPYVLEWMNPAPPRTAATRAPLAPAPASPPAFDTPAPGKPAADKPLADKKDSTLIPVPAPAAPAPPTTSAPPMRTDLKSEPRPAATPPARPAPDPKTTAKTAPSASKPAADSKSKTAAAPTRPAKPPAPAKSDAKSAIASTPGASKPATAKATAPARPAAGGPYWVQVGAFKDPEAAKRLATKLRGENFKVEESVRQASGSPAPAPRAAATAPAGADQYDVFVTGMSADELNKRLAGRGLAAETSGNGVVVKPSLPLRDAVALSKDLAVEGFKVQVRRAGGAAAAPATPAPGAAAGEGTTLHRVRVGAFADRDAARAAARELTAKGYKPFIARGDQ